MAKAANAKPKTFSNGTLEGGAYVETISNNIIFGQSIKLSNN